MKTFKLFFALLTLGYVSCTTSYNGEQQSAITMKSLLHEMVNRDQLTYFPKTKYKSVEATSYNRESRSPEKPGWFVDSDGLGFIRTENINGHKEWVVMEDNGPGCITKMWGVCFYYGLQDTIGPNIHIYLDGDTVPAISTNFFKLLKGQDFIPTPFASESTRAGNCYLPIPYAQSCKVTFDKKSFYNIINYRKYPKGTQIETFRKELMNTYAQDLREVGQALIAPKTPKGESKHHELEIAANQSQTIDLPKGTKALKQLSLKLLAQHSPEALRKITIKGVFDNNQTLSAPIGDLFSTVDKIIPYNMWERSINLDGTMTSRWVMPYQKEAKLIFENHSNEAVNIDLNTWTSSYSWNDNSMYFHASFHSKKPTPTFPIFDMNFLTAEGSGVIVGDSWNVLNPSEGWWGEGDEKIYIDEDFDRNFPSHFGTGTEDYYGWAGGIVPNPEDQFSTPFVANIQVASPNSMGYNTCSRTRSLDAIPFSNRVQFDFESSCGRRETSFFLQYNYLVFWYGKPNTKEKTPRVNEQTDLKLWKLEELQEVVKKAQKDIYRAEGAIEAENLQPSSIHNAKKSIANLNVWGTLSNNKMSSFWFQNKGDYIEYKLSEQFEPSVIKINGTVGPNYGIYDIFVNGVKIKTQDMYSPQDNFTSPMINLGTIKPVNNAFIIRFVYQGQNKRGYKTKEHCALGIDYFKIENNFLKR